MKNNSIIYAGFNAIGNLKIGETGRPSKRFYDLRETEGFEQTITYPVNGGGAERKYFEAIARVILEKKGYKRLGNDHFLTRENEIEQEVLSEQIYDLYRIIEQKAPQLITEIMDEWMGA